jgi:hypothetical protein
MSTARFVSACSVSIAVISVASLAFAEPELKTRISTTRPEVGEPYTIQLSALVQPGEVVPADPQLKPPKGATIVSGPNVGQSVVVINGSARVGIDSTWQIVSNAPGKIKFPAPTVLWAGRRVSGQPIEVDIVKASGRPRRSTNPFLLPGGPGFGGLGFPFGGLDPVDAERFLPPIDEKLEIATAPDPHVFLHAKADRTTAVVGEQVTVSFYLYYDINVSRDEYHDAESSDFLRYSLSIDPGAERLHDSRARAGGHTYNVKFIDRVALFPLRTGDLHVGSIRQYFTAREIGRHVLRESEDLVIRVTEPPRKGRPAGYKLGDVGRFSVSANVEPRRIPFGGTLAVTARVSGNGNFPQSLAIPERTGVEWLDPEKRESISPQGGIIAGYRTFGYVVRVKEAGKINLGKIDLPHWDPTSKKYQVASADLGTVDVLPEKLDPAASASGSPTTASSAGSSGTAPAAADPFANIPGTRTSLGVYQPPPAPVFDGPRLYFALGAPPLAYAFFSAGLAASRRLRSRRDAGAVSPERLARAALDDAAKARANADVKAVCAAIERALHHALKAATDLETRGILLDELTDELENAGLAEDMAARIHNAFEEISALRYVPEANDASLEDILRRGQMLVRELLANPVRDRG